MRVLRVYSSSFSFSTKGEIDFVDITEKANGIVKESEIEEGLALLFAPHATGAIILNENDPSLLEDLRDLLERIIPKDGYRHPFNAHSHLRSIIMEPSKVIPVSNGRLRLGTWQSIIWVEVDTRPRNRTVLVTVVGE